MRFEDVEIGMKVIPFKKSAGSRYKEGEFKEYLNEFFKNSEGVFYVNKINKNSEEIGMWNYYDGMSCDWFKAEDFDLYTELKQNQPKKETKEMEKKETIQQLTKREKGRKIQEMRKKLGVEKTLRNGNALIVWFKDGTKIVEKASVGDIFDYEIGIALAYVHYLAGSKSIYKRAVDKITDTVPVVIGK